MAKSGRAHAHQWYLISFAEDEEEDEVSGAACNKPMAVWHCWMLFLPVFQDSDSCWLLPLDPAVVCYPTANLVDHSEGKNGFYGLAFTCCPNAAGLCHQERTLMGPLSPAEGATWQMHSVRVYIDSWTPCGPPFTRNRSWSSMTIWQVSCLARLSAQLHMWFGLFVCKYMFNSNWLFKQRLYKNNEEDDLRMTESIIQNVLYFIYYIACIKCIHVCVYICVYIPSA